MSATHWVVGNDNVAKTESVYNKQKEASPTPQSIYSFILNTRIDMVMSICVCVRMKFSKTKSVLARIVHLANLPSQYTLNCKLFSMIEC